MDDFAEALKRTVQDAAIALGVAAPNTHWTWSTEDDFSDPQQAAETAIEQLGHRVVSIFDPQRGVLKLFLDPPEWMSPASLERADDDFRARR